jgi:hypothetical protein
MKRIKHKGILETDVNVHLLTESDQGTALPKADRWLLLGEAKEARLHIVAALWTTMWGVSMKTIQNLQR